MGRGKECSGEASEVATGSCAICILSSVNDSLDRIVWATCCTTVVQVVTGGQSVVVAGASAAVREAKSMVQIYTQSGLLDFDLS